MTVTSLTSAISHTGTGATDTFTFPFKVFAQTDLVVNTYVIATGALTLLTLTTDYTVTLIDGGDGGGSVTLVAGNLPATHKIIIQRVLPITQETDFVENDPFPAESDEDALDKLTMIIQQLKEQIDRALLGTITTESGVIILFPGSDVPTITGADALKIIQVNAASTAYELVTVTAAITTVINAAINIFAMTEKNPPISTDIFMIEDSADGYSKKKVQIGNMASAIGVNPIGSIMLWSTATAPTGYLLCDGKTVGDATSGADYAGDAYEDLYNIIEDTYGGTHNWSNHDTITLPNLKGRAAIGAGQGSTYANGVDAAGTNFALAGSSGMEKHILVTAELAAHAHQEVYSHSGGQTAATAGTSGGTANTGVAVGTAQQTGLAALNTMDAGSDTAHNNMQPYLVLNYIIKY